MNIQIVPGYASKEFRDFLGTAFLWNRTKEGIGYWERKYSLQDKIIVEDIKKYTNIHYILVNLDFVNLNLLLPLKSKSYKEK